MLIISQNGRLDLDTMATTSTSTKFTTSRNSMMRVGRSFLSFMLQSTNVIDYRQIQEKKTSRTQKTSPTFANTMRWMLRQNTKSKWTKCPSWNKTYPRSFGVTRGNGNHRLFYFTFTVLFCWVKFWDAAGQNFLVNYPVTYFVLYVSLLVLARLSDS